MKGIRKIIIILFLALILSVVLLTLARVIGHLFGLEEERAYCNRMPQISYGFLSDLKLKYQHETWRDTLFGTRCLDYVY